MGSKKTPLKKSDILYHLLKGWRIIILFTLIGFIAGVSFIAFGYVRGEMTKEYSVSASIAIVAQNEKGQFSADSVYPHKTDVDTARAITEDAVYIIKSHDNLQEVINNLNLRGVSAGTISGNLQAQPLQRHRRSSS